MSDSVSIAPTGRATCKRCLQKIDKGAARLTHGFPSDEFDGEISHHYHVRCAMEVLPETLARELRRFKRPFADRDDLERDLAALLARTKKGAAATAVPDEAIVQQGDAEGRPRGRILFCTSQSCHEIRKQFRENGKTDLVSPQRDYVFVLPQRDPQDVGVDDPSVPILGCIVVSWHDIDTLEGEIRRLSLWRQRRLPTPVLWVVSNRKTTVDDLEQSLRELLESAGFSGDNAPVFRSERMTGKALRELVVELDTMLPDRGVVRETRTATQRALDTIVELASEGRIEATREIFEMLWAALDPQRRDPRARYFAHKYGYLNDGATRANDSVWRIGAGREIERLTREPLTAEHIRAFEQCAAVPRMFELVAQVYKRLRCAPGVEKPKLVAPPGVTKPKRVAVKSAKTPAKKTVAKPRAARSTKKSR